MKRWFYFSYMLALILILAGCSLTEGGASASTCPPGLYSVNGLCLDPPTTNFVGCMTGRGQNLNQEDKVKLGGAVQTAAKVAGAQGVVEVARYVSRTEDSEVAKGVLQECVELTRRSPGASPSEQSGLDQLEQELRQRGMGKNGPPTMHLTPSRGPVATPIHVEGENWPPTVELSIMEDGNETRVTTDAQGGFSGTVSVPSFLGHATFEGKNAEIVVMPVDPLIMIRSPILRVTAVYQIVR